MPFKTGRDFEGPLLMRGAQRRWWWWPQGISRANVHTSLSCSGCKWAEKLNHVDTPVRGLPRPA